MPNVIKRTNVICFVLYKDKTLAIKRRLDDDSCPGMWEAICGGVEEGEDLKEAMRREVKEETGLKIGKLEQIMTANYSFEKTNGDIKEITAHLFKTRLSKLPEIELSEEHISKRWIDYHSDLELMVTFKSKADLYFVWIKQLIKDAKI